VNRIGIRGGPGFHEDHSWEAFGAAWTPARIERPFSQEGVGPQRNAAFTQADDRMAIRCEGIEFASEIVIKTARAKLNAVVTPC